MPLDLPLSALRKHSKDRVTDVDAFLAKVLPAPDVKPARDDEAPESGAQPSERP